MINSLDEANSGKNYKNKIFILPGSQKLKENGGVALCNKTKKIDKW